MKMWAHMCVHGITRWSFVCVWARQSFVCACTRDEGRGGPNMKLVVGLNCSFQLKYAAVERITGRWWGPETSNVGHLACFSREISRFLGSMLKFRPAYSVWKWKRISRKQSQLPSKLHFTFNFHSTYRLWKWKWNVLFRRRNALSTGERPFIDILQDRRYWLIHLITIPSLFLAGVIFILSGFVYKLFRLPNFNQYFQSEAVKNTQISLINDRFSVLNEIEDVWMDSNNFCVFKKIELCLLCITPKIFYGKTFVHSLYGRRFYLVIFRRKSDIISVFGTWNSFWTLYFFL